MASACPQTDISSPMLISSPLLIGDQVQNTPSFSPQGDNQMECKCPNNIVTPHVHLVTNNINGKEIYSSPASRNSYELTETNSMTKLPYSEILDKLNEIDQIDGNSIFCKPSIARIKKALEALTMIAQ